MPNRKEDEVYQKHQLEQMNMEDDFQKLFLGSDEGKRVMENIRNFCKYDEMCIGKDNNETNQLLGSRRVFVFIRDSINHRYTKTVNARKQKENSTDGKRENTKG